MPDRPRPVDRPRRIERVEWAQEILGHGDPSTTYAWLRRNGIRVIRGWFSTERFYAVFEAGGFDSDEAAEGLDL